jgi:hypothetical protein
LLIVKTDGVAEDRSIPDPGHGGDDQRRIEPTGKESAKRHLAHQSAFYRLVQKGFKFIGGIFGLSRGGVVPAVAGGWSLPGFGSDTVPAMLTPGEMVLPAHISEGLQNMIGEGGGAGAGDLHMHFHGPADRASMTRFFADLMGDNPEAFMRPLRSAAFRLQGA